jgi:hypothetical protein
VISELAFARDARLEPHTNPNTTYFIVIEGGGWVGVGDARTRIAAGEAACWPPNVIHTAWTEHSEMRALVVEFGGADDQGSVLGRGRELSPGEGRPADRAVGSLADRVTEGPRRRPSDGEPV